jgi:hypothetical protein
MSKMKKGAIVLTVLYVLISTVILFNWVYVQNYSSQAAFWMVFIRTWVLLTLAPLVVLWGGWWIIKK